MADLFDVTPKKIVQALAYWESLSVLSLEYADGEISDVTILPIRGKHTEEVAQKAPKQAEEVPVKKEESAPSIPANVTPLRTNPAPVKPISFDDPNVQNLQELAQWYLKKPLSSAMCEAIAVSYAALSENEPLCEYLLEYCIERGHSSPHYLKTVAQAWAEEGYKDVQEVKQSIASRGKTVYAVMKELGLGSREPATQEADSIRKWLQDFELPVVLEACRRTIAKIHEPSFSYVNGILSDWKDHGVTSVQDIEVLDKQHEEKKNAAAAVNSAAKKNSFHNGLERNNDYDELMKKLAQS